MTLQHHPWGTVEDKCYANNPQTIIDLKGEVHAEIKIIHDTIEKLNASNGL